MRVRISPDPLSGFCYSPADYQVARVREAFSRPGDFKSVSSISMDAYPPFLRSVCLAKRAELAHNSAMAICHLDEATRLTDDRGSLLQIEKWRVRLSNQSRLTNKQKSKAQL